MPVGVIVGRRGSGKSTLAKAIIPAFSRVLIVDPNHEYEGKIFDSLGALYTDLRGGGRFRAIYRPPLGVAGKEELDAVDCVAQIAWSVGRCLLVIDEADRYTRMGKDTLPFIHALIHQGRHRGVGLLGIARRPEGLPKDLIGNARYLYAFHLSEPYSRAYLGRILGDRSAELGTLADGEYLVCSERGGIDRRAVPLPGRRAAR